MTATLALLAHDRHRDALVALVREYQPVFARYRLLAPQVTGERLQTVPNLAVELLLAEASGGEVQIAAEVAAGNIAAAIFLVDAATSSVDPAVQTLRQMCDLHNVPLATNLATAMAIVGSLARTRVAHLIFNPVAGQGNSEQELDLIQRMLEPHFHLEVHQTSVEVCAEHLAEKAVAAHADLVIASGGDGTVSAVAGALIGTETPLGIIPRGTANAFAAALGISATLTPIRNACQVILAGKTRNVDAAYCNGLPMVLLAGIGLEAEVVERADRETKDRWGALAYLMAGWQQLDEQQLFDTEIEMDGKIERFQAGAITIANAAPITSVLAQGIGQVVFDDGLLDVTIASASSKLEAIRLMTQLLGAALMKPVNSPNVVHMGARRLKVTTNPPQKVVVDGEVIGTTPVEIECIPGGLTVFAP
ncbi:MAG: methylglyoxal synthase [Leptolyngbya sp. IPPAS B-1204]|uniref:Methylglyoxal synthase n=1 Tax=Leptolyngbya sp. NK1-12 TaxID=2547451 RepID=A0AA96WHI7_9CYAN|nr:methylglyoxal synthase [Leptolyngbya sp. NK1-12]MBF2047654.1 methylglyoxal synthase [Elainella sp. C42_A2020_010]RNJ70601.1 MAG: methylglyoxal synthase [Leptolyngbya sp. IPPAS B-1204]WNZ25249.1 methylglyoxal synthase [Leptolyngbya sp. NK1-12]